MSVTRLTEKYRIALVQDLKIGLKYIRIIKEHYDIDPKKDYKETKLLKNTYFQIMIIRGQLLQGESKEDYIQYKKDIKKFTKNKEIWII